MNADLEGDAWINALDPTTFMLFIGDRWLATIPASPLDHVSLNQRLFALRSPRAA